MNPDTDTDTPRIPDTRIPGTRIPGARATPLQTPSGALRAPLSQTLVRSLLLGLLAGEVLLTHLAAPQTGHGQDLLRLLRAMTLLGLLVVIVLTRRQGRPQQAALLAVPLLGVLVAGTVGADTLMDGAVNLLIQYPVTCAAVVVTGGLLILAALLGEALSEDR